MTDGKDSPYRHREYSSRFSPVFHFVRSAIFTRVCVVKSLENPHPAPRMKPQTKAILTATLANILTLSTACGAAIPSQELAAEQPTQTASAAETLPPAESSAKPAATKTALESSEASATAAEKSSLPCVTWSDYQTGGPRMPEGFETGCVFRVGQSMSAAVNILRNELDLDTITAPGVTATEYMDGPIPWFQGHEASKLSEAMENGDVVTYYQACATIGGQTSNCDGFPDGEAYIINDNTACLEGECLGVPDVHAVYLLSLWDWPSTIYDLPTTVSADQTSIRNQYRTVPLNQLPTDINLVGSPNAIAMEALGRTVLEEGEQPTTIRDDGYNAEDGTRSLYVVNEGLADDAVGGYRYRLDFVSFDGDNSKLIWVGRQQYCRRSDEWTRETCS